MYKRICGTLLSLVCLNKISWFPILSDISFPVKWNRTFYTTKELHAFELHTVLFFFFLQPLLNIIWGMLASLKYFILAVTYLR